MSLAGDKSNTKAFQKENLRKDAIREGRVACQPGVSVVETALHLPERHEAETLLTRR